MDELEEILEKLLPKMRAEYHGFTFPQSFVAEMLQKVHERYLRRLLQNNINPEFYSASVHDLIKYICGFHFSQTANMTDAQRIAQTKNDVYKEFLVASVTEEVLFMENNNISATRIINEYNPIYCRFNILLDYLLNLGINERLSKKNKAVHVLMKLFSTAFLKLKGITALFAKGLEKEAIILWRSLHELECVISVLCRYGDDVVLAFEKFDKFSVSREYMDEETALEYDAQIERLGINVKNNNEIDHFENYGWLGAIPELEITKWNLNFRFLEDIAGLSERYKEYQVACDASHMNSKVLKWDKHRIFDFVVKRCYNSLLFILTNYSDFLQKNSIPPDKNITSNMLSALQHSIDVFLPESQI